VKTTARFDRVSHSSAHFANFLSASQDNALYFQYGCNLDHIKARPGRNFDAIGGYSRDRFPTFLFTLEHDWKLESS